MKTLVALAAALALIVAGSPVSASGPFGPPDPEAGVDETSLGAGYFEYAAEWEPSEGNFADVKFRQKQAYVQILSASMSFAERGGWFLRLGAADFDDGAGFKDSYKPFGTVGFKDVWYGERRSSFQVGTIFMGSYYFPYKETAVLSSGISVEAEVKSRWDAGLGIALQWNLANRVSVYGGPMISYGTATVSREGGGVKDEATFKEKDIAGLFAGARLRLSRRWMICAEGQFRGEASGGATVIYSFE